MFSTLTHRVQPLPRLTAPGHPGHGLPEPHWNMADRYLLRWLGNFCNLSTPAGLLAGRLAACRMYAGPRGLVIAENYRLDFPVAGAFTIGNVILLRGGLPDYPTGLLDHEDVHAWQYLAFGPLFLPLYALATAWSWVRTGDRAAGNFFERHAGLARGGYRTD